MQQEFARASRFVLGMTRTFVGLNIGVVEKDLVLLDPREGVIEIRQAGTDGFHLRSLQCDTRLYPFENLIVVERATIGGDLAGHNSVSREGFSKPWQPVPAETHR